MEKAIRGMFIIALSALLLYSGWSLYSVRSSLREAEAVLYGLQREAETLSRTNQSLRLGLEQAGNGEALHRIAREQLGLVLPEDRIYIIGDEN